MKNEKSIFHSIEWIRLVVCSIIILFHLEGDLISESLIDDDLRFFSFGKESIGIFFVISGYITSFQIIRQEKGMHNMLMKRLIRIYPTYLFVGTLYLIIRILFNRFDHISLNHFVNTIFLSFGERGAKNFVYVGWTLFYEVIFFSIIYLLGDNFQKILNSKYIFQIIFLSSVILYVFNLNYFIYHILGILLYKSINQEKTIKASKKVFILSSLSFLIYINLGVYYFLAFVITGILIQLELSGINFKNRWLLSFTKATYSMYLIQVLTLPLFMKLLKYTINFYSSRNILSNRLIIYIFGLFLTMIFGIALLKIIESPINNYLQKRFIK